MPKIRIEEHNGHGILVVQVPYHILLTEEAEMQGIDPDSDENRVWRRREFNVTRNPIINWGEAREDPAYVRVKFADGERRMLRMSLPAFRKMWLDWETKQPALPLPWKKN